MMKKTDRFLLDFASFYKEEIYPKVKQLRGFTRIYEFLEEMTLRKITAKKEAYYEFKPGNKSLRIKDRRDLKYFMMEKEFVENFLNSINEGSVVCDVGSYHGFYSILGSIGEGSYAFEMSRENYEVIKENFELNELPTSNAINKAVWSGEGKLEAGMEDSSTNTVGDGEQIDSISLDEFFREKDQPDIVKIDVEGAEYQVLKGMTDLMREYKPKIFLEIHSEEMIERQGGTREGVLQLLTENGYEEEFSQERGSETLKIFK